jgi:hypothetical protein
VIKIKQTIIVAVLMTIVAGAGGFFGGMKYQQSKSPKVAGRFTANGARGQMPAGQRNNTGGSRPVSGKVIAKDEKGVTIELADKSSKIILFSDSSNINKTEKGTVDDISEGSQIVVFGQENPDGSISAQNIQIGTPEFGQTQK